LQSKTRLAFEYDGYGKKLEVEEGRTLKTTIVTFLSNFFVEDNNATSQLSQKSRIR